MHIRAALLHQVLDDRQVFIIAPILEACVARRPTDGVILLGMHVGAALLHQELDDLQVALARCLVESAVNSEFWNYYFGIIIRLELKQEE